MGKCGIGDKIISRHALNFSYLVSTYDHYEPVPQLKCPRCGAQLTNWQGYDGPNKFLLWRQGTAEPIDQLVDTEVQLLDNKAQYRLPGHFVVRSLCSCGTTHEADGVCKNGCWNETKLVTPDNLFQRSDESDEIFFARRRQVYQRFSVLPGGSPLKKVPATVFAALTANEIRIILHPGVGLADGGFPCDVPVNDVPPELRMPNSLLWVEFDTDMKIVQIWRRSKSSEPT